MKNCENSIVFISYRRTQSAHAGRLYERLLQWLEPSAIFFDQTTIEIGEIFPVVIEKNIRMAKVFLIVIEPDWLNELQRRFDANEPDYVRKEIQLASACSDTIKIPLYFGGATPRCFDLTSVSEPLRTELNFLSVIHAQTFHGTQGNIDYQFEQLRKKLEKMPELLGFFRQDISCAAQVIKLPSQPIGRYFHDPHKYINVLSAYLTNNKNPYIFPVLLHGMAGVGKTYLALKYSHDYNTNYDVIWWLSASNPTLLQQEMYELCECFGIERMPEQPTKNKLERYFRSNKRKHLLVFDDADDPLGLLQNIPSVWNCHVIITSRNSFVENKIQCIALNPWSSTDSSEFLVSRLDYKFSEDLIQIGTNVGGLPLALELIASYMESTVISPREYLELPASDIFILSEADDFCPPAHREHFLNTLCKTFDKLDKAESMLMKLLSFGSAAKLPELLIKSNSKVFCEPLRSLVSNDLAWCNTIAKLKSYALLDRVSDEYGNNFLYVHKLTAMAMQSAAAPKYCKLFEKIVWKSRPKPDNLDEKINFWNMLSPNIEAIHETLHSDWYDQPTHMNILYAIGDCLEVQGHLEAAANTIYDAMQIDLEINGADNDYLLERMTDFAALMKKLGFFEKALELEEIVYEAHSHMFGENSLQSIRLASCLAITYKNLNKQKKLRKIKKKILEAFDNFMVNSNNVDDFWVMNDLVNVLMELDELEKASDLGELSVKLAKKFFGETNPKTLMALERLAICVATSGELEKSHSIFSYVLMNSPEKDILYYMTKSNLSNVLREMGRGEEAKALDKEVLEQHLVVLGGESLHTFQAMLNLSSSYMLLEQFQEAEDLQKKALEGCVDVFGDENPITISLVESLVETLNALGKKEEAFLVKSKFRTA